MKEKDVLNVEIIDVNDFGKGIAKKNSFVIFINDTIVGDIVKIEIQKVTRKYAIAKKISFIKKSKLRTEKICPYSNICNCTFVNVNYDYQLQYKKQKIEHLFLKNSNLDIKVNDIISSLKTKYRNKAVFHLNGKVNGYYKEETNTLININKCILLKDKINRIYNLIQKFNLIDECTIRTNEKEEVLISFLKEIPSELFMLLQKYCISIYVKNELKFGQKYLNYEIDNLIFKINHKSFFQVNLESFNKVLKKVETYVDKNDSVLDLYCGVGIIGIYLSFYVNNVTGIEISKAAIACALENKRVNKLKNINFICGKVEDNIDKFNGINCIVVDPPRKGLDKTTINNILRINPQKLIYISCNPNTLTRDINLLKNLYKVNNLTLVDMFPNTYHVECVCVLKLR